MAKGGARENAGRKPKDEEQKLVELLKPHSAEVIEKMVELAKKGNSRMIVLFMQYCYGFPKPLEETKEHVRIEIIGEKYKLINEQSDNTSTSE